MCCRCGCCDCIRQTSTGPDSSREPFSTGVGFIARLQATSGGDVAPRKKGSCRLNISDVVMSDVNMKMFCSGLTQLSPNVSSWLLR